jgi:hypothetical protein
MLQTLTIGPVGIGDGRLASALVRRDQGCLSWAFGMFDLRPLLCLVIWESPYLGGLHVLFFWFLRRLGARSEGKCLTWIKASPLNDNKDGLLKQNLKEVAYRYGQERHFISLKRPRLVSSYLYKGCFSVLTETTLQLALTPPFRTGHPPRDRLRGRFALAISNLRTIS